MSGVSLRDPKTVVFFNRHASRQDFKRMALAQLTIAATQDGFTLECVSYAKTKAGNIAVGQIVKKNA